MCASLSPPVLQLNGDALVFVAAIVSAALICSEGSPPPLSWRQIGPSVMCEARVEDEIGAVGDRERPPAVVLVNVVVVVVWLLVRVPVGAVTEATVVSRVREDAPPVMARLVGA